MRSTRASAAVERLKARSGNALYSMSRRSDGLFTLRLISATGQSAPVGSALSIDEFVRFVNGLEAGQPKRVSKLDAAFRKQLNNQ